MLTIEVFNRTGDQASFNLLPFVPPKDMLLPANADVSATVGDVVSAAGEIPISIATTATAMYVVLTTLANGRFSDNAFLLEAGGAPRTIMFIPWGDAAGAAGSPAIQRTLALLKSSLRVEHLAQNLA